jgi:hypothetical protein
MLRRTERIRRARRMRREPIVNVVVVKEGEEPPPKPPKQDGVVTITVTFADMSPVPARERPDAVGDPAKTLEARAVVPTVEAAARHQRANERSADTVEQEFTRSLPLTPEGGSMPS